MPIAQPPLVLVTADRSLNGMHHSHSAGEKYLTAVTRGADCTPLILPALIDDIEFDNLLDRIDGVLLTGGYSNIEPHHYDQQPAAGEDERDPERDKT
ncbi:MAG: gamma-glutamyl-gamma-aminobutyrate hydrolase family protein, partial [Porticoccaceae bacterium]